MLYLGIDIGKNTHVAFLIDETAKPLFKAFSFSNTTYGANSLIEKLSVHINNQSEVEIGMEATGHYWLSIHSFLVEKEFIVHVVNPIQTDGWRKGTEIMKRKTAIIDSILIVDLIRYGDFVETSLSDEDTMSLRNPSRFRNYLVSSIGDLKRKVICVLDQVFPEYHTAFSDVFGKTSKEHLFHFQTADDIEQIKFIDAQVSDVEAEMKSILDKINSPIMTVPGVGNINAAVILGEIGDISRFSKASKLAAYAGIDASVSQSGEHQSTNNKMSKRGSPYLREALFQAALSAVFHDPVFSAFYQKKIADGKHHLTAVGAVARKLCNTIFAVLKYDTPYIPQIK